MLEQPFSPGRLTRVLLLPATIALLGLLGGCQSPRTGGPAAGRLICMKSEFNFGRVTQAESVSLVHVFTIVNPGSTPIRVDRVRTSCGCTAATFTSRTLPPGGRLRVRVVADWKGRAGQISTFALVYASGPPRPPLVLTASGFVLSPLSAIQPRLNFGWLAPGHRRTRVLTICGGTTTKGPVLVYRVTGLPPNATATPVPGEAFGVPGAAARMRSEDLRVTFSGLPDRAIQRGGLRVFVAGMGSLRVRFAADSYGGLTPEPRELLLVGRRGNATVGRLLIGTWSDRRPDLRVVGAAGGIGLRASIAGAPVHPGHRWWWPVVVRLRRPPVSGGPVGRLVFSSGSATVLVPVQFFEE